MLAYPRKILAYVLWGLEVKDKTADADDIPERLEAAIDSAAAERKGKVRAAGAGDR